jgi:hypothetical protein
MERFKRILQIGLTIALVFPFAFIFLTIANSKDCNQLVIDTYEIHSNIDIPKVLPINCYYDDNAKVRISVHELQKSINLGGFIIVDKDKGLNSLSGKFLLSEDDLPDSDKLRIATGENWGHTWTYVFEKETMKLLVELSY